MHRAGALRLLLEYGGHPLSREEALAVAAHDLRTPLSCVSLSAALLERSVDEQVKSKAGVIRRAAARAT